MQSYVFFQSWLVLSADPSVVRFVDTHVFIDSSPINDFRKEAEVCLKDLGTERYTVLILVKSRNSKLETFPIVPRLNSGDFP